MVKYTRLLLVLTVAFVAVFMSKHGLSQPHETLPEIDHPVVDHADVLKETAIERISKKLRKHHRETGVQMAVLLVNSTQGASIEDYSLAVARKWGGGSSERDDGVLLTFAIEDRRNRLEVGYGLEEILTDSLASQFLNAAAPTLRAERYGEAAEQIVDKVISRTSHLSPGEGVPTTLSHLLALALVAFAFLVPLLQAYAWVSRTGKLRGGASSPAPVSESTGTERPGDWESLADYGGPSTFKKILFWAWPPLLLLVVARLLPFPPTWILPDAVPAVAWLLGLWAASAALSVSLLQYAGRPAFFWVVFLLHHPIIGYAVYEWAIQAHISMLFLMGIVIFMAYFAFWIFLYGSGPFFFEDQKEITMGNRSIEETVFQQHRDSTSSSSSGGSSGGHSGGGGGFGGGGASGSW